MRFTTNIASAALAVIATLTPAQAQFEGRTADEVVQVRLLEGWRQDNGRHMAAIHIALAPGWKTYWRAPGEGGIPPRLQIERAEGVDGMLIRWPRPEVFYSNGMRSIGYREDVVLPLELALSGPGPHSLEGRIDLGVCLDVCMPVTLDLAGTLPDSTRRDPMIAAALADQPLSADEAGAGAATCTVTPISDGLRVEVRMRVPPVGSDETVVMELPDPAIWISEASTTRQGEMVTAVADVVPPDAGPFAMDRGDLRITVLGTRSAVELQGCEG